MDRHTLEQLGNQVDELLRHGSPSCIREARSIMAENFDSVLRFALDLTEPKPKPKHTIADNFPAGGLTATEPCMHCENYGELEQQRDDLLAACEDALSKLNWPIYTDNEKLTMKPCREKLKREITKAKL